MEPATRRPGSRRHPAARAAVDRAGGPPDVAHRRSHRGGRAERRRGQRRHRALRARPRLPAERRGAAGRALARRRHRRGRLPAGQGRRGGVVCRAACWRRRSSGPRTCASRGRARGPREGWVLELADGRLPGAWGLFELDVDALIAPRAEARRLRGRDHVSGRQAGSRVLGRRAGDGGRARRGRAGGRRPGAARDGGVRRLPRRAGRARGGSRSPSACRSRRPTGRSRTKTQRRYASGSSPRSSAQFDAELRA